MTNYEVPHSGANELGAFLNEASQPFFGIEHFLNAMPDVTGPHVNREELLRTSRISLSSGYFYQVEEGLQATVGSYRSRRLRAGFLTGEQKGG